MLYRRAAAAYQKASIETSPVRILDALLGRLVTDLDDARQAIVDRDIKAKNTAVDHALAILGELNLALDRRQAPELCTQLHGLYGFVEERLLMASLHLKPEPLDEAKPIVEVIRTAFQDAMGMKP